MMSHRRGSTEGEEIDMHSRENCHVVSCHLHWITNMCSFPTDSSPLSLRDVSQNPL